MSDTDLTIPPDGLADSYARDPRVDTYPGKAGYRVLTDDGVFEVLFTGIFGWSVCQGPDHEFVQLPEGGVTDAHFAIGGGSAGEIIRGMIGDPRR